MIRTGCIGLAFAASLALGAGCKSDTFACEVDGDCGDGGTCQPDRYCSFDDSTCGSGQRYGDFAGNGMAGLCVAFVPGASTGQSTDTQTTITPTEDTTSTPSTTTPVTSTSSPSTTSPSTTATTVSTSSQTTTSSTTNPEESSSSTGGVDTTGDSSTSGETTDTGEPPCGQEFSDAFDYGAFEGGWKLFNNTGGSNHSMTESGGQLRWEFVANEVSFVGLRRTVPGALRYFRAELGATPAEPNAQLAVLLGGLDELFFIIWNATSVQIRRGDTTIANWPIEDGPFVEVRVRDNSLVLSSSADGVTYSEQSSPALPFAFADIQYQVYGQTWMSGPNVASGSLEHVEICTD